MTDIKDILKDGILLTDGAMGTYYSTLGGRCERAEFANIEQPELIEKIHREYVEAGAQFIRTNTFAANTIALGCDRGCLKRLIAAAYDIAKRAADGRAAVAADIGPTAVDEDYDEYYFIIDTWLELGADIFVLETFTEPYTAAALARYIKQKNKSAYVHVSYSLTDTGYTKNSYYCAELIQSAERNNDVDSVGFNCGVGPMHLSNILSQMTYFPHKKPVFAMPNAGYPEMINGKVCYTLNPEYFAEMLVQCVHKDIKAVGGCCGTTPQHIALLREKLVGLKLKKPAAVVKAAGTEQKEEKQSSFARKLREGKFVVAVELDPPFKPDCRKVIEGAHLLKECGVDIITAADSPMGKSRVDSVIMSLKIQREAGIEVLPHICCRDKNAVSLRSVLLGAYAEGIRNTLIVTGDPVPGEHRADIKSVFNMNSYTLIDMITQMNNSVFDEGKIFIGGAVNFNAKHKDAEYKRLLKKHENGADFFLTQPIYDGETIDYIKSLPKDRDFKILAGIMPPVSYKNVQFLNNELAGVSVPDEIVNSFSPDMTREEAQLAGENIAVDIISRIKDSVDGLYIIAPFNRCQMVRSILQKVDLLK